MKRTAQAAASPVGKAPKKTALKKKKIDTPISSSAATTRQTVGLMPSVSGSRKMRTTDLLAHLGQGNQLSGRPRTLSARSASVVVQPADIPDTQPEYCTFTKEEFQKFKQDMLGRPVPVRYAEGIGAEGAKEHGFVSGAHCWIMQLLGA